ARRAPGGGRKPRGPYTGKSATISTRIRLETRRALQAEARRRGWSLSQLYEHVAQLYFKGTVITAAERRNQSLATAVALLAERLEVITGATWRENRYTAEALYAGVKSLIVYFLSEGDLVVPPQFADDPQSPYHLPEALGDMTAYSLIVEMRR